MVFLRSSGIYDWKREFLTGSEGDWKKDIVYLEYQANIQYEMHIKI